ncbi:MAG: 3'-5' exonuclease [Candidatus Zixiibacteriota bacterium]
MRTMTMGGSKGLTVRATIIAGLEEGLVPRPDGIVSEERRILYVAMTRARQYVFGTWATRRRGPTARHGAGGTNRRRCTPFFDGGPVESQDGQEYIRARF